MRSMEFTGRTVDEAIFAGLNEMNVTIDQVEIETVQHESKGLFGLGAKKAVVRLTEREIATVPDFKEMARSDSPKRERRDDDRPRRDSDSRDARPPRRDSDSRDARPPRREGERRERPARSEQPREAEQSTSEPIPYTKELAESNETAIFLQQLLGKMQIEGTVLAAEMDGGLRLNIESGTDGLLIGRHGDTLDALQYIVSLYANRNRKETGMVRVTVDTEGYRARREDALRSMARRSAARVVKTNRPMAMEPMNPYERRVLHSALQGFRGVTTHSEGEEPNRRVIITPER